VRCPYCAQLSSKVVDSRELSTSVRRRRECLSCRRRFTTYEQPAEQMMVVVKRDGRREDFDRRKLSESIRSACHKRPVPLDHIERVVTEIEGELLHSGQREISSRDIGERVMLALKKLDEIAYVRFASVYRSFRDVDTLADEIAEYKDWKLRDAESKRQMPLSL
jgi:transcriptional repressor NrdR